MTVRILVKSSFMWKTPLSRELYHFFNVKFGFTLIEVFAWVLNGLKMYMFPAGHNV